jgi:hypothetical protein
MKFLHVDIIEFNHLTDNSRYLVATTTIWSGLSYIYTKDAVKILNKEDKSPPPPKSP